MYNTHVESGTAINEYLYSNRNTQFDSATLADGTVTADSDGDKILYRGTVLAKITSGTDSGKVGAYSTGASDGRESTTNIIGISEERVNVRRGDVEIAYLYAGTVKGDNVYSNGTQGSVAADVKSALRGEKVHIMFR